MSREFAKAVWACYNAEDTDLKEIPSLAELRASVQSLDIEPTSDAPKGIDDEEDN